MHNFVGKKFKWLGLGLHGPFGYWEELQLGSVEYEKLKNGKKSAIECDRKQNF